MHIELSDKLTIAQLFTSVWYGDWHHYEKSISNLPIDLTDRLTFHAYYKPKKIKSKYAQHFLNEGEKYVSPFITSYYGADQEEKARQNLLSLVAFYENLAYYYPAEKEQLPDHFGSITGF